jgi:hypothetical protein
MSQKQFFQSFDIDINKYQKRLLINSEESKMESKDMCDCEETCATCLCQEKPKPENPVKYEMDGIDTICF